MSVHTVSVKKKKHVSADEVLPSLTCSRSQRSHRGRQAAGSAESVWSGQQRSGKLRTVRVHSRRIQQPALSLQRQTHCSASQAERQLEKRDGRHTDGPRGIYRDGWAIGKAAGVVSPQLSPGEAESLPCLSLWLFHNFSLSSPLATCHLLFSPHSSVSPPSPAASCSISLLHHPIHSSSLCCYQLSSSPPSSPCPGSGCACRLRRFCQGVCKDQRKVLQCRWRRRLFIAVLGPAQTITPIQKKDMII